jgi:hypothetical protein
MFEHLADALIAYNVRFNQNTKYFTLQEFSQTELFSKSSEYDFFKYEII